MIDFTTLYGGPVVSQEALPVLTNATFYLSFRANSTTNRMHLIDFDIFYAIGHGHVLYIQNGLLKWATPDAILGAEEERWSCPISANVNYSVGLKFNFNTSSSVAPTVYLNGVKQTMTKETSSGDIEDHRSAKFCIGGQLLFSESLAYSTDYTNRFDGVIGDFYIANRTHSDVEMERHTKSRIKGFSWYHQKGNCLVYCPMDEVKDKDLLAYSTDLIPTGDISGDWNTKTQSTYWQSINVDSTTDYMEADGGDDGKEMVFDTGTFTLPTGSICRILEIVVRGYVEDTEKNILTNIYVAGSWLPTNWGMTLGTSDGYAYKRIYGNFTQSDLDNLQLKIKAPSSIGIFERIRVYYATIRVWYTPKPCKDWMGTYHLAGMLDNGYAENYLSYVTGMQ